MVQVDLESRAGIIDVRANAFTPEDARAIARAILAESSALVNRLSDQAREDAVRFAREELAEAEANLREQRAKLADFRREHRLVDPTADVAGQIGLLNALQGELAKAMVERDELLTFAGADDQRVLQADRRIDAINERIEAERSTPRRLGAGTGRCPRWSAPTRSSRSTSSSPTPPIPRRWPAVAAARGRGAAPVALPRAAHPADAGRDLALSAPRRCSPAWSRCS